MGERQRPRWFGASAGRLGFGPLTWQGRAATFLYVFLVIVAVVIYSALSLTLLVIGLYTVAFVLLVAFTSDLMDHWPPGS
jgi:hypothetical protein